MMEIKLQLGAAAVIVNGLAAMSLVSPSPAFAAGCSTYNYNIEAICAAPPNHLCSSVPGCTLTETCVSIYPDAGVIQTQCRYT
jgi:hypothetical protein